MLWIDKNSLMKLNIAKNNEKEVLVEMVNSYGETGTVKGVMVNNPKFRIVDSFDLLLKAPNGKDIRLDILLDRPNDKFNTFCALNVKDVVTNDTLYENVNREVLLTSNFKNFNRNDDKNKEWLNDEGTKFMLNNIGQYVEFTPSKESIERGYRPVKGILKSSYNANMGNNSKIIQILMDSNPSNTIAQIRLPKEYTMTATSFVTGKTDSINYVSKEKEVEDQLVK